MYHPSTSYPSTYHPRASHPSAYHPRVSHPSMYHPITSYPRASHPSTGHHQQLHSDSVAAFLDITGCITIQYHAIHHLARVNIISYQSYTPVLHSTRLPTMHPWMCKMNHQVCSPPDTDTHSNIISNKTRRLGETRDRGQIEQISTIRTCQYSKSLNSTTSTCSEQQVIVIYVMQHANQNFLDNIMNILLHIYCQAQPQLKSTQLNSN